MIVLWFMVVVSVAALVLGILSASMRLAGSRRRRAHAVEVARLARLPLADLLSQTRSLLDGWKDFPAAEHLMSDGAIQSHADLLRALKALFAELDAADERDQAQGRSSRIFEFHDIGLVTIVAAVEQRLQTPGD